MRKVILTGKQLEDKVSNLKKIKVDSENWIIYYMDDSTGEKWKKEYPEGEAHGGGAPVLTKINKFPWE